jgi:polyferredoxin
VLANFGALHVVPLMALGTLIAVGALVGTLVCGWACPFGYLQDLAGKVPTPRFQLPRRAGHLRYAVLAGLVVAVPFFLTQEHPLFICRVCPAGALEAALPAAVGQAFRGEQVIWPSGLKIGVTLALVGLAFFTWRPWCRLFCPLGAIYGLFNRFSGFFLRFHPDRCTQCGRCHKACKYGVAPGERANDPRCLRCLECTECGAFSFGTAFTGPEGARSRPPRRADA